MSFPTGAPLRASFAEEPPQQPSCPVLMLTHHREHLNLMLNDIILPDVTKGIQGWQTPRVCGRVVKLSRDVLFSGHEI